MLVHAVFGWEDLAPHVFVCMNTGVLCVCEYDSQRCKQSVSFVYVWVILETVVHALVKER